MSFAAENLHSNPAPTLDESLGESASDLFSESESESLTVEQLKEKLSQHLCTPEEVRHPEGLATGLAELDRFLFWHGLPKGALTLFQGSLGTGATSLWLEAAQRTVKAGKWVAWINRDVPLSPLPLKQKGMNLGHFVSIETPTDANESAAQEKTFWLLQELMSSSLFELVGCDLGNQQLKDHQLRKLQAQARDANIALVFFSQNDGQSDRKGSNPRKFGRVRGTTASIFSLIVSFQKKQILVERALHRPTPHSLPRSVSYARFILGANMANTSEQPNELNTTSSSSSDNGNTRALFETPRANINR